MTVHTSAQRAMRPAFTSPANPQRLTAADIVRERQARLLIKLIAGLAGLTMLLTILAQTTGIGAAKPELGQPVAGFTVTMMEQPDGSVALASAADGSVIAGFEKGRGGFLRGAIRAFSLQRRQHSVPPQAPFEITRWDSGRLTLTDTATGHRIPLDAFGPSVERMFAPLVDAR
jgi:putative photosynthetic complex assembly protein